MIKMAKELIFHFQKNIHEKLLITALTATTLFACKSNMETKPGFDLVNAKKEIDSANKSFEDYVSKGDSVGLATNVYTMTAKFMAPNGPSAEGRSAVISAVSGIFKAGITGIKLHSNEIWGDENAITEEAHLI